MMSGALATNASCTSRPMVIGGWAAMLGAPHAARHGRVDNVSGRTVARLYSSRNREDRFRAIGHSPRPTLADSSTLCQHAVTSAPLRGVIEDLSGRLPRARRADVIIHSAAQTDFKVAAESYARVNVDSVENMIRLARGADAALDASAPRSSTGCARTRRSTTTSSSATCARRSRASGCSPTACGACDVPVAEPRRRRPHRGDRAPADPAARVRLHLPRGGADVPRVRASTSWRRTCSHARSWRCSSTRRTVRSPRPRSTGRSSSTRSSPDARRDRDGGRTRERRRGEGDRAARAGTRVLRRL